MYKTSCFTGLFDKQHGKRVEPLWKSSSQHLYYIHWSLSSKLSWKRALLLTCQILGLLVNTLPADEKYPLLNRDNLTIPIQMELSQKQKTFSQYFASFFKSRIISNILKKKMTFIDFLFPILRPPKTWSDKSLKSRVSEDSSPRNMVNLLKDCWNLHQSIIIIFIDQCQVKWVDRSLCFWYSKSLDSLLTHWQLMKSILFFLETI